MSVYTSTSLADSANRLIVARLLLGITRAEVAERLNLSPRTYKQYELGERSFLDKLPEIAEALQMPRDFFSKGPISLLSSRQLSYRKRASLKSAAMLRVKGMSSIATELVRQLDKYIEVPHVKVPFAPVTGLLEAEAVSRKIRQDFGMGDAPLRNAIDLAESLGVSVFYMHGERSFDGVSFWCEDRPFIILNRDQQDGYRSRFTVLHELGHLIMHRSFDREEESDERKRLSDLEADRFASAFLMPSTSFVRKFPRYPDLVALLEERKFWMASCAALIRRARDLKLIEPDTYQGLYIELSSNGWRKKEPGSPYPESSRIHSFFLMEAGDKGIYTDSIASDSGLPVNIVKEAIPVASEFMRHSLSITDLRSAG